MSEQDAATQKPTLYSTSDIYFASYLMAMDFPLKNTEKQKGDDGKPKLVFVFLLPSEQTKERMKILYFGQQGTIKVKKFVDSFRALKSMCYV